MKNMPNYTVEKTTDDLILIKDIGPWHIFPTVTNRAEEVVLELAEKLNGRKLFYVDSDGELGELCIADGKFSKFGPAPHTAVLSPPSFTGRS